MEPDLQPYSTGEHNMPGAARQKTLYESLEALPEGITGEILHGQLHTHPRPAPAHAIAESRLAGLLSSAYDLGRRGSSRWWIIVEPELHFVRDREVLVPDLAGWQRTRMPELPDDQRIELVPDWICEILSPATRSKDREIKMPLYARRGVAFAWIVDPTARTLEAYTLRAGEWAPPAVYGAGDRVTAAPFEAVSFLVADLWS